jgi:tripartite-type tricarboxylate transporter receptor subunit TctC
MTPRRRVLALLAAASGALPLGAAAQGVFPSRPVRIVVPFAPGGSTDAIARLIAAKLSEQFGQNVVVENKAGANSIIGTGEVAKAAPDGHTLLVVTPSLTINPFVVAKLPYDASKDLAPVTLISRSPYVVGVSNEVPAANLRELIAYSKANPGKLSYASGGNGTGAHLTTESFKMATGVDMVHVPYKGTGPALPDLVAGRVALIFDVEPVLGPMIKDKRVRGFAITGAQRSATAPDVPTMAEAGVPGFVTGSWIGLFAPAGTPADIVQRLQQEVRRALQAPDAAERMRSLGTETVASTPAEFATHLRAETERWGAVARHIGLKPE